MASFQRKITGANMVLSNIFLSGAADTPDQDFSASPLDFKDREGALCALQRYIFTTRECG